MTTNNTNLIFDELLNELQSPLFNFIFSLLPHKQDAEDVLQKTNIILCAKKEEYDPILGHFKGWAYKIARYQVMAHRTLNARSRICFSNELAEAMAYEAIDYETPEIQRNALNKCYKKLPKHMQLIAELRFKKSLTVKQISDSIDRPEGSVTATLFRVRENIKKRIDSAYFEAKKEFYTQQS